MIFRIHFADGEKIDIDAETPAAAAKEAGRRRPGVPVLKTKLVRAS
jgi:hypothetical protein